MSEGRNPDIAREGKPLRAVFLTRSLEVGGAERQIVALTRKLDRRRFSIAVVCFYAGGPLERQVAEQGVEIIVLGKRGRWHAAGFLLQLVRALRRLKPAVLMSYLPVPNILSVLLKPLVHAGVVWATYRYHAHRGFFVWVTYGFEAMLSRFASEVIVDSNAARDECIRRGMSPRKLVVVPNGVDVNHFRPDAMARLRARRELNIPDHTIVIGIVGRLDPVKRHEMFLQAASRLLSDYPDVRFLIVGGGSAARTAELAALASSLGLNHALVWTGERHDIASLTNAFDIATNCSAVESLPTAVLEAMACGVPCVVTDVGDSRLIIGDTGVVIPRESAAELANAWHQMISNHEVAPQERARQRIVEQYSQDSFVTATASVLTRHSRR